MTEAADSPPASGPDFAPDYKAWERFILLFTPLCVVLTLSLAVYLPSLAAPFLFDDLDLIVNNESFLQGESVAEYSEKYRFRQEVMRSYKRDLVLSGGTEPDPMIFHAANVLTHLGVVALLYWLLLQLGRRIGFSLKERMSLAFLGSAIFSLHPLTTEPVAYVTGRADLLATWYSLISLLFFAIPLSYQPEGETGPDAAQSRATTLPARTYWKVLGGCWLLSLACFAKGILCKELAVVTPALIVLVLALAPGETRPWRTRSLVGLLVAFAIVIALVVTRLVVFGTLGNPDVQRPLFSTLASNAFAVMSYLFLWLVPGRQSGDHDSLIFAGFDGLIVLIAVAVVALFLWGAWKLRKRYPEVSLGMFWCMVGLAPTTSIVALEDVLVERRFYLSAMGLALAAAGILVRAGSAIRARRGREPIGWKKPALVVALGFLMLLSIQRVFVWSNRILFWADAAQKAQFNPRPYYNLGTTLIEEGKSETAIAVFATLFRYDLYDRDAHLNVANAMMEAGWIDYAQRFYKSNVLTIDPDNAEARYNLGVIAERKGEFKSAEQYYKEALHLKPEMAEAAVKLGVFNFSRDEPRVAAEYFEEALSKDSGNVLAHRYLALIYGQMLVDEARSLLHLQELTKLEPESPSNWLNLGIMQERMSRFDEARRSYRRVLDLDPASVDARVNFGALLDRLGHVMEACKLYREAADLDPSREVLVRQRCGTPGPALDSTP